MIKRMILIVSLFLAASLMSGCVAAPLIPVLGASSQIIPVVGVSYEGYTVWKGRESTRYYATDLDTTYQAVKKATEQLRIETVIQNSASENGHSLETKGNHPMQIDVSEIEKNLTKVVVTIELLGDKQYVELFYRTVDDNIPKKEVTDKEKNLIVK